jgi:hypothetical protein
MPPSALVIDIEKTSPPAGAANAANGPRTQEEWDAMLEPLRLELEQGTRGISELLVPMGSAAAAYKLGRALAPRLGALGRIAGPVFEAGGALLGRRANIQLGYEEPSTAGDIAAAALPLAARGALTGVRTLAENAQFHGAMWRGRSTPLTGLRKLARAGIPGVAIGTLLSTLMGHSQVHWAVGGSFALLRFLLDHAAETPWGYQVLRQVLKGGQALSGPALSALLQVGRIKGQETLQQIQRPGQAPDTWDIAYPPTTDQTPDTWDTPYPPAAGR